VSSQLKLKVTPELITFILTMLFHVFK